MPLTSCVTHLISYTVTQQKLVHIMGWKTLSINFSCPMPVQFSLFNLRYTYVLINNVHCNYYASRRSRTRDTVKLTVCLCVCVCVSVPAVTAQRLQCDEN